MGSPSGEVRHFLSRPASPLFSRYLKELKARGLHTAVYSGNTVEVLACRRDVEVREAVHLIALLVDGPFVAALADGAGEWRRSRNQPLLYQPGRTLAGADQEIQ